MDRYIDMAFIQERKFTMQRTCVIGIGLVIHIYLFYKKWKSSLRMYINWKCYSFFYQSKYNDTLIKFYL